MRQFLSLFSLLVILTLCGMLAPTAVASPVAQSSGTGVKGTAPSPAASEQTTPPSPLPVGELSLPEIAEARLANGLQVVVVPTPSLPLLLVELVLPGGQSAEPEQLSGVSDFTAGLLTRGTTTRSAQEIAAAIEQVGGSLVAGASRDSISVTASVLSEYTDLAFELLGDVTLNPTFPSDELETYRQRALTSLRADLATPSTVAGRVFGAVIYGEHPYGEVTTRESLQAVTREAVMDYYASQFSPEGAILVLVGDITLEDAVERAEATFGQWSAEGQSGSVTYPAPPQRTQRTIYLVDRPGSSQVEMVLGHPGVQGANPERYPLLVANQVLGGGSTSRLYQDLREEKGFTYGIYSYFTFPRDVGEFVVSAAVRNDVVGPALQEILREMEQLVDSPLPVEELEAAKSYLIGSYALRLETSQALAGQIASLKLRHLPLDLIGDYAQLIEPVGPEVAQQMARKYIHPDEIAIVVVGDASQIRESLAEIGPVVMVDANGRPLER